MIVCSSYGFFRSAGFHEGNAAPRRVLIFLCGVVLALSFGGAMRVTAATVGYTTPGTTAYPDGGLHYMSEIGREAYPKCALHDPTTGFVYFLMDSSPPQIVKVAFSPDINPPERVAVATLELDEMLIKCGVIDPANGYAYFAASESPAKIIKVALGAGKEAPRHVAVLPLDLLDDELMCAAIDTASQMAYFGTNTNPARIIKVALGAGDTTPTRVTSITLPGEDRFLTSAALDPVSGYAYFGTQSNPGRVVKIKTRPSADPPQCVSSLELLAGESNLKTVALDPVRGYGYFGTYTDPGRVVKVRLEAGNTTPTRMGAVTLSAGEGLPLVSLLHEMNARLFLGMGTMPGRVVKVALGTGPAPPTRVGAVTLDNGEDTIRCGALDQTTGYMLFGPDAAPGQVVKVFQGTLGSDPPLRCSAVTLHSIDQSPNCVVYNTNNDFLLFGTDTIPGKVVKAHVSASGSGMNRQNVLTLPAGEENLQVALADVAHNYAYFATGGSPARFVKVEMGGLWDVPVRTAGITLAAGENIAAQCGVIDVTKGYAYLGTYTSPGRVVKVALGDGAAPPSRIGALTLNAGEDNLSCAAIDVTNGYAYFGGATTPGRIVKAALGSGAALPTRVGSVENAEGPMGTGVIDSINGFGYFGTNKTNASIIKIALNGSDAPAWVGTTFLNSNGRNLVSSVIDPQRGCAWFAENFTPGRVLTIGLDTAIASFKGSLTLGQTEGYVKCAVMDTKMGQMFMGANTYPSNAHRVAASQMDYAHATRVVMPESGIVTDMRFYSMTDAGQLRLAIFDDNPTMTCLWQSNSVYNTVSHDFVTVAVPSLRLNPGVYWLAWQTNSTFDLGSYLAGGAMGDGILGHNPYGPYPSQAQKAQATMTSDRWTQYITYTPAVTTWRDDTFSTGAIAPPGSLGGWGAFGFQSALGWPDYDPARHVYQAYVPQNPDHYRVTGVISNWQEWMPYSSVGTDHCVRTKYYIYAALQENPSDGNQIPNMRLRAQTRFAVNSMLEVFNHTGDTAAQTAMEQELRPSIDPLKPSLYRVDLMPVSVPYLIENSAVEGIQRAFEAYAIYPQDNGILAMCESVIGVYTASFASDPTPPIKIYAPFGGGAGDLAVKVPSELDIANLIPGASEGEFATRDNAATPGQLATHAESAGGITVDSANVPTNRVGYVSREFTPADTFPAAVRVEEQKQYTIRWHITSTQHTNQQSQVRMRARSIKFGWSQKLEVGGAWAAGSYSNTIAQQALPGVGCQNLDRYPYDTQGGWHTLVMHTPMSIDIRPEFSTAVPLSGRMPNICAQPGPGADAASRRDLRVGFDLIDTISGGAQRDLERGNFALDRIEVRAYDLVPD